MREGIYYNGFLIQIEKVSEYYKRASIYKLSDKGYKIGEEINVTEEEKVVTMNIWDNYYTSNYDLNKINELHKVINYTIKIALGK